MELFWGYGISWSSWAVTIALYHVTRSAIYSFIQMSLGVDVRLGRLWPWLQQPQYLFASAYIILSSSTTYCHPHPTSLYLLASLAPNHSSMHIIPLTQLPPSIKLFNKGPRSPMDNDVVIIEPLLQSPLVLQRWLFTSGGWARRKLHPGSVYEEVWVEISTCSGSCIFFLLFWWWCWWR